MLLSMLLAIAGLTSNAQATVSQANVTQACTNYFATKDVSAEICDLNSNERIVQISFTRSEKTTLVVHAQFSRSLFPNSSNGFDKMWTRFWTTGAMPRLTRDDQINLAEALNNIPPSKLDESVRGLSDFLVNFVEPNTRLENFDAATMAGKSGAFLNGRARSLYTNICAFRGQVREATYTIKKRVRVVFAIVGQTENKCRGRCGTSCSQPYFQWNHNQYTQECLNHDACRDEVGEIFGECSDEFWIAAAGYVSAPDCEPL